MFEVHLRCEDEQLGLLLRLAHPISKLVELTPIEAGAPAQLPAPNRPLSIARVRQLADARASKAMKPKKPLLREQLMAEHTAALKARKSIKDIILEALGSGPKATSELTRLGMDAGWGRSTTSVTLNNLKITGKVSSPRMAEWALADGPPAPKPRPPGSPTGVEVILEILRGGPKHRSAISPAYEAAGHPQSSIAGRLYDATKRGLIERTGVGIYKLKEPQDG